MEQSGVSFDDRAVWIYFPSLPRKSLQLLSALLRAFSLPHLLCVYSGVCLVLLNKAVLNGPFWSNIRRAIANPVSSMAHGKHGPRCLGNNHPRVLHNDPIK